MTNLNKYPETEERPKCPGDPKDYVWVKDFWNRGHWRKKPVFRFKEKIIHADDIQRPVETTQVKPENYVESDLVNALQNALERFTGSKDPKDLSNAGKPIPNFKIKHVSGAITKYLHPSGISEHGSYNMQYAVVELDKLITSHNPEQNFKPDSRFNQKIQDRDYTKNAEIEKVVDIAARLQPEYMLSAAVTAAEGTPIITKNGIVLSGNGRTIALKYAVDNYPKSIERYIVELNLQCPRFAILRNDLKQFKYPVLVRVVDIDSESEEAEEFGHAANAKIGAARSENREAGHLAELLTMDFLLKIKDADDETISKILEQDEFKKFLKNNIAVKDLQTYFRESGELTEQGKAIIKRAMLIKCLGSAETIEEMTDSQVKSYMSALPALVDMRQRESKGEIESKYSISGLISEAIHFFRREIINEGFDNFEHFKKQLTITEKGTCSKEVEKYIRITDEIGSRSTLLRLFLVELVKACEAESGLSSGLLSTVKPATFLETIELAWQKAKEANKKKKIVPTMLSPKQIKEIEERKQRIKEKAPHGVFLTVMRDYEEKKDINKVVETAAAGFRGKAHELIRQELISAFYGKKIPKSECGVAKLEEVFKEYIEIRKGIKEASPSLLGNYSGLDLANFIKVAKKAFKNTKQKFSKASAKRKALDAANTGNYAQAIKYLSVL